MRSAERDRPAPVEWRAEANREVNALLRADRLREARQRSNRPRGEERGGVAAVDKVFQPGLSELVEPGAGTEADRPTVRQDHAVENHRQAGLLPRLDVDRLAKSAGAARDQQALARAVVHVGGHHRVDGTGEVSAKAIGEHGLQKFAFAQDLELVGASLRWRLGQHLGQFGYRLDQWLFRGGGDRSGLV